MHVHESTDTAGLLVLLAFVRCIYKNQVEEKILFAKLCLFIIQEKIFSIKLTCTWPRNALVGNNVLMFAQKVHN
jgi:hypothetical protein